MFFIKLMFIILVIIGFELNIIMDLLMFIFMKFYFKGMEIYCFLGVNIRYFVCIGLNFIF